MSRPVSTSTGVRILPVAAVALTLLLGLKLAGLGPDVLALLGSGEAFAADTEEAHGDKPAAADEAAHAPAAGHDDKADAGHKDEDATDLAEAGPTGAEADVLEQLAKRREQLDARERELDMREKTIAAAEKRIEERVAELKTIQAKVEEMFGKRDEAEEKQLADLVKMYETMKPASAAAIFNTLDAGVLLDVVARMKPAKASPILAAMKPERAQEVTVELARRGRLPDETAALPADTAAEPAPAPAAAKPGG